MLHAHQDSHLDSTIEQTRLMVSLHEVCLGLFFHSYHMVSCHLINHGHNWKLMEIVSIRSSKKPEQFHGRMIYRSFQKFTLLFLFRFTYVVKKVILCCKKSNSKSLRVIRLSKPCNLERKRLEIQMSTMQWPFITL